MRLALTPGDPRGIGPEVACKALVARRRAGDPADVVLIGDVAALSAEAARWGLDVAWVPTLDAPTPPGVTPCFSPSGPQAVEVEALVAAVDACRAGRLAGLVTGPIHKARLAATGFRYAGHTDFLGDLCDAPDPVMAFVGGSLRVALVTTHLPLRAVADAVTAARVARVLDLVHDASRRHLGLSTPRIAVCGVNPHAGDDGLLGTEDRDVVGPAVEAARSRGVDARGPVSAEAAFRAAADGRVDWVVAMYHDQGLAPLKLVDFGRSVNWTLGLPIVRTSVDHGTADDIAGQGVADPAGMDAALRLAEALVRPRP